MKTKQRKYALSGIATAALMALSTLRATHNLPLKLKLVS